MIIEIYKKICFSHLQIKKILCQATTKAQSQHKIIQMSQNKWTLMKTKNCENIIKEIKNFKMQKLTVKLIRL